MVEKERRTDQDRRENMKRRVSNDLDYSKPERRNTSCRIIEKDRSINQINEKLKNFTISI